MNVSENNSYVSLIRPSIKYLYNSYNYPLFEKDLYKNKRIKYYIKYI